MSYDVGEATESLENELIHLQQASLRTWPHALLSLLHADGAEPEGVRLLL